MKLGDTVQIVDIGQLYSTYEDMAAIMHLPNWKYNVSGPEFNNQLFIVVALENYSENTNIGICGIDNGSISFIIAPGGLKVIKKYHSVSRREKSKEYWEARDKLEEQ